MNKSHPEGQRRPRETYTPGEADYRELLRSDGSADLSRHSIYRLDAMYVFANHEHLAAGKALREFDGHGSTDPILMEVRDSLCWEVDRAWRMVSKIGRALEDDLRGKKKTDEEIRWHISTLNSKDPFPKETEPARNITIVGKILGPIGRKLRSAVECCLTPRMDA